MLTFIDLFSGIGGFRLGMEQAGHKCLGFCEYDKFAVASYRAMHDTEGEWYADDIRTIRASELPRADVWCFGFPCQDISVAGKQLGFDGKRSSLFFAVTKLIRDTKEEDKPTTLLIENVKNLLSVNGGIDFLKLLIELDEIGYDAEWQVLNSKDFGVPQNRERVFVVASLRGRGRREVFPISGTDGQTANVMTLITKGKNGKEPYQQDRVYDISGHATALSSTIGGRCNIAIPSVKVVGNVNPSGNGMNGNVFDSNGLAPTLTTNKGEGNKITIWGGLQEHQTPRTDGISPCLNSAMGMGGGQTPVIAIPILTPDRAEKRQNGRRFKTDGEPMFTLTGQDRHGVMINGMGQNFRIRKLLPIETFRLQGFPDEYFERAASVNSNSQLYKQSGNSVSVPVIYEIAKKL